MFPIKLMDMKWILFIFLFFMGSTVLADDVCLVSGGSRTLDTILNKFATTAFGWSSQIEIYAKRIFLMLFGMEFMWQLTVKKVFAGDVEKLWVFFFTRTVMGFFFYRYLVNMDLYVGIIQYFTNLGGQISGFIINASTGNIQMGPSEVLGYMNCMVSAIDKSSNIAGGITHPVFSIFMGFSQVIIIVCLSIIAFTLFKTLVQAYFMQYAGFIMTGFAGSSWTQPFWNGYLRGISSIAVKLFAICLVMSLISGVFATWAAQISSDLQHFENDTSALISTLTADIFLILATSIVICMIAYQLPEWAASILSGHINANFGQMIAGITAFGAGGYAAARGAMGVGHTALAGGSAIKAGAAKILGRSASSATGSIAADASAAISPFKNRINKAIHSITGGSDAKTGKQKVGAATLAHMAHSNLDRGLGSRSEVRGGDVNVNLHKE